MDVPVTSKQHSNVSFNQSSRCQLHTDSELGFPSAAGNLVSWFLKSNNYVNERRFPSAAGMLVSRFQSRYNYTNELRYPSAAGTLVNWFPPQLIQRVEVPERCRQARQLVLVEMQH